MLPPWKLKRMTDRAERVLGRDRKSRDETIDD